MKKTKRNDRRNGTHIFLLVRAQRPVPSASGEQWVCILFILMRRLPWDTQVNCGDVDADAGATFVMQEFRFGTLRVFLLSFRFVRHF